MDGDYNDQLIRGALRFGAYGLANFLHDLTLKI